MEKELPEKVVLAFAEIEDKIKKLYEKKASMLLKAVELYGVSKGVVEVPSEPKPFLRVVIKDNIADLEAGKTVYATTSFKEFSVEIKRLVKMPK